MKRVGEPTGKFSGCEDSSTSSENETSQKEKVSIGNPFMAMFQARELLSRITKKER
ncbi:hypothetical protein LPW11_07035 [Geomonas sp. RF6]|uniref:hypothetical protein n=1 Tax=Geomonas sp. RF6 TaxID=2897342 RepID=UPI001E446CB1|nr:hypothetical protein [Geomonas sp. RF6]UFS71938.1 hypothetical protein LPW11_07035 [Geomonas sp. RF6]